MLLSVFLDNIFPVMLIAPVGFALRHLFRIEPRPLASTVFYACVPALVFRLLVATRISSGEILSMMGFAVMVMVRVGALSFLVARVLCLQSTMASAFILATSFMNSGKLGLPLIRSAFGDEGFVWASLFYVATAILINSLGVFVADSKQRSIVSSLLGIGRNPALYAVLAALLVRAIGIILPSYLLTAVDTLGSAAVPLMVLVLGMQIDLRNLPSQYGLLATSVILRLLVSPLVAALLARMTGLSRTAQGVGILQAAMPSAVQMNILASQHEAEPRFVSGVVLVSTLLSPLTVTP